VTADADQLEVLRTRWRKGRERLRLLNPESPDFGTGGLGRLTREVAVRALILPPDPEAVVVRFDQEFWGWFESDRPNPFGGTTNWGNHTSPTAEAGARYERHTDDPWRWDRYLAVHRHGGLECGMGREVVRVWQLEQEGPVVRVFRLVPIVGRLWCLFDLYAEVAERYTLTGPWEASLALRRTAGSIFGNVGAGWAEPPDAWPDEPSRCPDPNVLIRREIAEWPDRDGRRDLAFALGEALEDAWGVRQRRFLARVGDEAGMFDTSRYG
jgi:hypothetical protein